MDWVLMAKSASLGLVAGGIVIAVLSALKKWQYRLKDQLIVAQSDLIKSLKIMVAQQDELITALKEKGILDNRLIKLQESVIQGTTNASADN